MQIVAECRLNLRHAPHFVGGVFEGFTDVLAELMVAGGHEIGDQRQFFAGEFEVPAGDEIDQVAGVKQKIAVFSGVADRLVEIPQAAPLFRSFETGTALCGKLPFAHIVAFVGVTEVGVGDVQQPERLRQSDSNTYF